MRLGVPFVYVLVWPAVAFAQQAPAVPADETVHVHEHGGGMPGMQRDASGTSWLPEESPVYAWHRMASGWHLMVHGNVFAQFLYESGEEHRRSHQAGSINWLMGMAQRPLGTGRLGVRAMVSAEPWSIGGCGYPNLLATGEVCDGDTIHDLQHPHDLFMELTATYDAPLAGAARWQVYAGAAGEPALGPPAFPHRLSAFPNPVAPISHHWLDATHITFGVATLGIYTPYWKIEGSAFNGREPDAERADLDFAAFDSFAGRLSIAPGDRWTLQVSMGRLREAEAGVGSEPRTDVTRVTASATYHRRFGVDGFWATTAAYGMNSETSIIPGGLRAESTHAGLLETSAAFGERQTWFGRLEAVGKPAHDLHVHEFITTTFPVGKLQAGYVRHLPPWKGFLPGIGGTVAVTVVPPLLAPRYGGRFAPGFGVFGTIRPREERIIPDRRAEG